MLTILCFLERSSEIRGSTAGTARALIKHSRPPRTTIVNFFRSLHYHSGNIALPRSLTFNTITMSTPPTDAADLSPAARIANMRGFLGRLGSPSPSSIDDATPAASAFGGEFDSSPVWDCLQLRGGDPGGVVFDAVSSNSTESVADLGEEAVEEMVRRLYHLLREATDFEYSEKEREGLMAINAIISEAHNRRHNAFVMAAARRDADIANLVCHSRSSSRGTSSCHTADSTIDTSDELPDALRMGGKTEGSSPSLNEEPPFNGNGVPGTIAFNLRLIPLPNPSGWASTPEQPTTPYQSVPSCPSASIQPGLLAIPQGSRCRRSRASPWQAGSL